MAVMVRKHTLGAHDSVAKFTEVLNLLVLVLEAEDFAGIRQLLIHLRWIAAVIATHVWCLAKVHWRGTLPLIKSVTHWGHR